MRTKIRGDNDDGEAGKAETLTQVRDDDDDDDGAVIQLEGSKSVGNEHHDDKEGNYENNRNY